MVWSWDTQSNPTYAKVLKKKKEKKKAGTLKAEIAWRTIAVAAAADTRFSNRLLLQSSMRRDIRR